MPQPVHPPTRHMSTVRSLLPGIYNNYFISPLYTAKSPANHFLFIESDDVDGKSRAADNAVLPVFVIGLFMYARAGALNPFP